MCAWRSPWISTPVPSWPWTGAITTTRYSASGPTARCPENLDDPREPPDRADSRDQKRRAKHDCSGEAPEEQAAAAQRIHAELLEHQRKDEDIVRAQAQLDQVAREVLLRGLRSSA